MTRTSKILVVFVLLFAAGFCEAQGADPIWGGDTLTDGLFGLNDILKAKGINVSLSATQIYQHNTHGGISHTTRGNLTSCV